MSLECVCEVLAQNNPHITYYNFENAYFGWTQKQAVFVHVQKALIVLNVPDNPDQSECLMLPLHPLIEVKSGCVMCVRVESPSVSV